MADLTPNTAKVGDASPVGMSIKLDLIAAVAITASQGVYQNSDGKAALADASAAGTALCWGVALETVSIGQSVPILMFGFVDGMGVSAVANDTIISVSNTAGAFDNGAGSPTVARPIGRVISATDSSLKKLVFVNCIDQLLILPA